ncbi:flagellar biosynthesis anti-sigma factor FlgM [Nitrospina gracilis]|uniref:flagellar biosynthesis anti-sigma factor FlgM n=1 Tax=Nitrospina gracilis TaxID=35801 RepID=UPI001F4307F9|nr:flagellar biosynthesis anti-sigma factor FlgM [Nitrospina gracilis]MCF8720652.1 anti-sigma28 factor (negative regulator of flagellin synthesis) [Nitrospina gracilis Nb-211]
MSKKAGNGKKGKGSEIRHEVVEFFRTGLKTGTYRVRARELADKMVQKIRDGRNPWLN